MLGDAPIAASLVGLDGDRIAVNQAFRRLFDSEVAIDVAIHRGGDAPARKLVRTALTGEPCMPVVHWYERVATSRIALEICASSLRATDGTVDGAVLWYRDVTLQSAEQQMLRALFDAAPEAIVVADARAGEILDVNVRAIELFGYPRTALVGASHLTLSWHEQGDGLAPASGIADAVARAHRGEIVELEWIYRTAHGEPLPCEVRIIHVPDGERVLCRVSLVDLRARRQAAAAVARLRELEEQNRRVAEASRLKSEFVAAMSHELRTPLNTVIGAAELLHDGSVAAGSPEAHEFIGDILTSGRHLLRLINDVLDLAKVEAGKLELRPEPVSLSTLLAEVTGLLRTQAQRKQIELVVERDPSLDHVTLDPLRFKQVLYNYLSNALKFTPGGGRVIVRTTVESPAWFLLEVEDSGIGVAADQRDRLFAEFSRLDTGAMRVEGTGLGLSLTRRIVQAQGGSVGMRSELGRGSIFYARLPRLGSTEV